jgi:glycosyltransferase involved in cell wall biosynthesis
MAMMPERWTGTRKSVSMEAGAATGSVWGGLEAQPEFALTVIVPTRNEADNVEALLERVGDALAGVPAEVVFVDDSDDTTPDVIDTVVRSRRFAGDFVVSLLHRPVGTRDGGLGGAVVAGLRLARSPWVAVMDGDLQHPPELLTKMLQTAETENATLVVASRYREGGDTAGLAGSTRTAVSIAASAVAKATFPRVLRSVTDPMSGFFMFRRDAVDPNTLRPRGFKILMEIAVRTPSLRVAEVPYVFGERFAGESKANSREGVRYLRHLGRLRVDLAKEQMHARGDSKTATHRYDIHGIISVEADARLPELEAFRVRDLDGPPSIRVRIGKLPQLPSRSRRDPFRRQIRYEEKLGNLGFAADISIGERVEVLATPLLRHSPHVLYTNLVEPILRWSFVARGYALAHGACVVEGDDAFMITARTDTGKTTTMLKLLDAKPYDFVADDLTIVCPDGRVLPYPKPLTISNHTLHAVNTPLLNWRERTTLPLQSRLHSRSGRRFAFLLTRTGLPVATINTLMQLIVPPPKYPVQRLVPGVRVAKPAKLAALFVIQRSRDGFEWLDEDEALEILLGNCEDAYGFPPYHSIEDFLLASTGDNLRAVERQIIAGALEGRRAALLSSTTLDWATRIPGLIEQVQTDLRAVPGEPKSWSRAAVTELSGGNGQNGNGNGNGEGHSSVTSIVPVEARA